MRLSLLASSLFVLSLAGLQPALADRRLPFEQEKKVEALLKKKGYAKWRKIELEKRLIEVDDAIAANGKRYELKLDPKTLAVVRRTRE